MPGRPVARNNVIAGLFVILSVLLAVAISIVVSGAQEKLVRTSKYIVRFSIEEGAAGLQPDSPVTLGGQAVGRVVGVFFQRGPGGEPTGVDVKVALRADLQIFEDAWVFLERPLLGTLGTINIARVGDGKAVTAHQGAGPQLEPGEVIAGDIAPPGFLAQAGYGPDQARQLQKILADGATVMERVDRVATRLETEAGPLLTEIRATVTDLNQSASEIRAKVPEWTERIDSVLAQTDQAAGRLSPIADQLSAAIKDADETIRSARLLIEDNRPNLDRIIANIEKAAERLNSESLNQLNSALASAKGGADEFAAAGREFNQLLAQERPNLERILANFRLASDQIKLTGIEVRRNPWRLLYTPTTKELESELFYDAARTYAEAVSDLRAASESLQTTGRDNPPTPESAAAAARITQQLNEAFDRYKEAERVLLQKMVEKRK